MVSNLERQRSYREGKVAPTVQTVLRPNKMFLSYNMFYIFKKSIRTKQVDHAVNILFKSIKEYDRKKCFSTEINSGNVDSFMLPKE